MKTRILIPNIHFMKTKILLLLMTSFAPTEVARILSFGKISAIETVPAGMVWKVTNIMPSTDSVSTSFNDSRGSVSIKVNGISVIVKNRDYHTENNIEGNTMSSWTTLSGAYWLPAGTTLAVDENCVYITVIEFSTQ